MSAMYGADVAELRRLAAEFRSAADDLDRDGAMLTRLLNGVDWLGGVANRFTNQWTGVQVPRMNLSTRFLRDAADQLAHNADQQEQASRGRQSASLPGPSIRGDFVNHFGMRVPLDPRQIMDLTKGVSGGVDSVLLLAPFFGVTGGLPPWLVARSDWTAVRMLGTRFHSLVRSGSDHVINGRLGGLTNSLRNVQGISLVKHGVDAAKSAGLAAVFGGLDVYLNQRDHGWGDAQTIGAQVDGALGTAASLVPGGGIVYGGTRAIGDVVHGKIDDVFDITGGAVDGYAERTWGVPADQLTPEQSDQLNRRYYGWSGLWNSNYDVAREIIDDAGGALGSVADGAGRVVESVAGAPVAVGRTIMGVFR